MIFSSILSALGLSNASIIEVAKCVFKLSRTIKDQINLEQFPNALVVAQHGEMSPSNTTPMLWVQEWPRKPDIVMEGGNHGIHNGSLIDPDSLQLLSTGKGGLGRPWFTAFGDTSAVTAAGIR